MTESVGVIEELLTPANVVNYVSVGIGILSVAASFYIANNLKPTDMVETKKVLISLIPVIVGGVITVKMITGND